MANNQLNTRIVICNDTTANWGTSEKVLLKGEIGIEITSGAPKFKVGDGVNKFSALAYATNTPEEITKAINSAVSAASHTHSNKSTLDAITAAFTTELKSQLTTAYNHSQAAHAPSNAEKNTIVTIQKNGAAITPDGNRAVNVTVPTKPSDIGAAASSHNQASSTINSMSGYSKASSASAITTSDTLNAAIGKLEKALDGKQASGSYAASSHKHTKADITDFAHTHDDRYYTETEMDTKLSGKANASHTHGNADITGLDASKLTGTIDIARLPKGALERCTVVADDTARFKLTTSSVQVGDTVKVTSTGKMYFVVDDSKLATEEGYEVYTAGSATSVPWSGVTGKPSTFTPSSHKHTKSEITDFSHSHSISDVSGLQTALDNKATSTQGGKADTAVQSVKISGSTTELKSGTTVTLPAYPTTLPASDVPAWAKAASKPSYTKAEVGLGNVDNTADSAKSVKYATSAGSASSATTASKLSTNAGDDNHPVKFANGVPVACNVSTDILKNGNSVLVLDGGGAS